MSEAARPPDPDDARRGMQMRPERGRAVLLGTFAGLIVLVFAIILLVSQCAPEDDDGDDDNAGGAGPAVSVVVDPPGSALLAT
ncbi:hypothetical protein SAMN05660657_04157 [Geodermatophilus amargosae]|uniref:Uncharacterized protein n=1 Tax=Geodermatophilus amargosae TaxID=1296565 RepID=A0A1I7C6U1_9ACTN|nr:hypothetical protein [Geodermatophilus amargosae]SFT95094.1 hypothetical protein SAMN05660657_04157 [Geodermatophilus amargosae]